jgi:hypothetical protein
MRLHLKPLLCLAALCLLMAPAAFGQGLTTGYLSGKVIDQDGGVLPGAQIEAVHGATGANYSGTTDETGRFRLINLRVGDYTVSASMDGFRTATMESVAVNLGGEQNIEFKLQLETVAETVVVTGEGTSLINASRMGATSNVSREAIETLPTVNRGIEDFARTNPLFTLSSTNDQAGFISVAGRNSRYNNIQIDGAVNNDIFGLAESGTPGGQTESQPISLDAVQELQLLVSPYDVRQGGFSGGGVNLVTKSGSRDFSGSVYGYYRDQDLVGDGSQDRPFGTFEEEQYGLTLGGPLFSDKAFFFLSGEISEKSTPSGFTAGGGTGIPFGASADVARVRDILITKYGYDPGDLTEYPRATDSDKYFARFDFNLNDSNQLVLRHNYVDALNDIGGPRPTSTVWVFPDRFYNFLDETNSTVGQLNTVFTGNSFNELRLGYQTIRDQRSGRSRFPSVQVQLPNGINIHAGTENFSTANSLDQDILEITDDYTFVRGNHTITIGTHNELFKFDNLFIRDAFGTYIFSSIANLEAGKALQYDHSFANSGDPNQSAKFKVNQYGLYVGDQWSVTPTFNLVYGLRGDAPEFPDTPTYNPVVEQLYGFRTDEMPDGKPVWSPRAGFNWDIGGEGKSQLRGGLGIFGGRTPYVWVSNNYANSGIDFTRINFRNTGNIINFVPNPDGQPKNLGTAATNEINIIDPDFEFPQQWRANIAYDLELPWMGLVATSEIIYSETIKDIHYANPNWVQNGVLFDGQPRVTRKSNQFSNVILLTNTELGDVWNGYVKLEKPYRDGWYGSVSYAYGYARSVNDGTSSQAISNWRFNNTNGGPSDEDLGVSVFDVRHRFNAVLSWSKALFGDNKTSVGLYYNHEAGRPYSTTFSLDVNGDAESNDLMYVPASADEVIVVGGTWDQLNAYIEADKGLREARGSIVNRNASRAPWRHDLDLALAQELPIGSTKLELTFDILNLSNLIDKDAGIKQYAAFSEISPVNFTGIDAATGKPRYQLNAVITNPAVTKFAIDDLRSRWQAKVGVRWRF